MNIQQTVKTEYGYPNICIYMYMCRGIDFCIDVHIHVHIYIYIYIYM